MTNKIDKTVLLIGEALIQHQLTPSTNYPLEKIKNTLQNSSGFCFVVFCHFFLHSILLCETEYIVIVKDKGRGVNKRGHMGL